MKVEILQYTKNPLTVIGTNASYCYNTKLKDDGHARRIAEHCLKSGHGRNLEFADITFKITASARMIRELYTHIGGSPTRVQASTRYITYNDFAYVLPVGLNEEQEQIYKSTMKSIQNGYNQLKELGCKNDITGYILPLAMESTCIVKMNARTLENMFNQRLCNRALLEFKSIMGALRQKIKALDEEWCWIADKLFVSKCIKQGGCFEEYPCQLVKNGTIKHLFIK